MTDTPLFPAPVYGLRTWLVDARDQAGERLVAPQRHTAWPTGGAPFVAHCAEPRHVPPVAGCSCGVHAWHPTAASARRVCSVRREVPGILEGTGAIEVHREGFRAARGRPHALVLLPNRNAAQLERLARAYGAELLRLDGPRALLAYCRAHGLGLDASTVAELLGSENVVHERRAARRRRGVAALRTAAVVVALAGVGAAADHHQEHGKVLHGRAGAVRVR